MSRVTALFDNETQAEAAVRDLRGMGVADAHLSLISQRGDREFGEYDPDTHSEAGTAAADTGKGALAGAGVGALFGLAAFAIPGIGPFITAGTLGVALSSAAAGAAAGGAIVGGTAGAIAGALAKHGYSKEEAEHYGAAVHGGQVLVAVDSHEGVSDDQVRAILSRHGGNSYAAA